MARSISTSLVPFLRSVPIFGGLEGRSLDRVMAVLEEQNFAVGETIFNEGELGRTMYVLQDGEVDVLRTSAEGRPTSIVRLGPGEVFGEMSLVELQPRSATVVVTKKVKTFSLTNLDLYNLYREDNYAYVIILQNICRMLSRRLRKADSRIADFLTGGQAAPAPKRPKAAAKPAKRRRGVAARPRKR